MAFSNASSQCTALIVNVFPLVTADQALTIHLHLVLCINLLILLACVQLLTKPIMWNLTSTQHPPKPTHARPHAWMPRRIAPHVQHPHILYVLKLHVAPQLLLLLQLALRLLLRRLPLRIEGAHPAKKLRELLGENGVERLFGMYPVHSA